MKALRLRIPAAELAFVSFSVDPGTDTPEVLTAYKRKHGIADTDGWTFVTGPTDDVLGLVEQGFLTGVERSDPGSGDGGITHGTRVVLVDAHRHIRGFYATDRDEDVERLERDAARARLSMTGTPFRDRRRPLLQRSLAASTRPSSSASSGNVEVWMVDDGSGDSTGAELAAIAARSDGRVRALANPVNLGKAETVRRHLVAPALPVRPSSASSTPTSRPLWTNGSRCCSCWPTRDIEAVTGARVAPLRTRDPPFRCAPLRRPHLLDRRVAGHRRAMVRHAVRGQGLPHAGPRCSKRCPSRSSRAGPSTSN